MSEELSPQPLKEEIESFIYSKILVRPADPEKSSRELQLRVGGGIERDRLERQGGFIASERIVELVQDGELGDKFVVYAPRMGGKTSALLTAKKRLQAGSYIPVFLDCQGIEEPDFLETALLEEFAESLGQKLSGKEIAGKTPEERAALWQQLEQEVGYPNRQIVFLFDEASLKGVKGCHRVFKQAEEVANRCGKMVSGIGEISMIHFTSTKDARLKKLIFPQSGKNFLEIPLATNQGIRSILTTDEGKPRFTPGYENWIIEQSDGFPWIAASITNVSLNQATSYIQFAKVQREDLNPEAFKQKMMKQLRKPSALTYVADEVIQMFPVGRWEAMTQDAKFLPQVKHLGRVYPVGSPLFQYFLRKEAVKHLGETSDTDRRNWEKQVFEPFTERLIKLRSEKAA